MKGFFVTGTDTGIGKTIVSAALMCALGERRKICYWKPIQTGIEEDNDTLTVKNLAKLSTDEIVDIGFRLEKPLSPYLSARLANVEITVDKVLQFIENAEKEKFYIVEGAGGVLVPLNETELMIDLIKTLNLPVIVVARSGLGTINHTCLTLQTLRIQSINVFGVVMNGKQNVENRKAIEHFGKVQVLAELPKFEKLESETLNAWAKENLLCRL